MFFSLFGSGTEEGIETGRRGGTKERRKEFLLVIFFLFFFFLFFLFYGFIFGTDVATVDEVGKMPMYLGMHGEIDLGSVVHLFYLGRERERKRQSSSFLAGCCIFI